MVIRNDTIKQNLDPLQPESSNYLQRNQPKLEN